MKTKQNKTLTVLICGPIVPRVCILVALLSFIESFTSKHGEENGDPLQYSCLENLMDGGSWLATVHGVAKSWAQLNDFTSLHLPPNKLISLLVLLISASVSLRESQHII